jgi:hypothetical protein
MSEAILSLRAHFDGKVIVPDEPVNLPMNAALDVDVRPHVAATRIEEATVTQRLAALDRFMAQGAQGANIPGEMLRREHLYGDDER